LYPEHPDRPTITQKPAVGSLPEKGGSGRVLACRSGCPKGLQGESRQRREELPDNRMRVRVKRNKNQPQGRCSGLYPEHTDCPRITLQPAAGSLPEKGGSGRVSARRPGVSPGSNLPRKVGRASRPAALAGKKGHELENMTNRRWKFRKISLKTP